MAVNIRKWIWGIGLTPNSSQQSTVVGELEVLNTDNKLYYHNNVLASPVVTESNLTTAGDITGTIPVTNGGTGNATLTAHTVLVGEGTSAIAQVGPGTSGQPLLSGGASADPAYGTLGIGAGGTGQVTQQAALNALAGAVTSGDFLRGDGTNVSMSAIQAADVPTLNQNTTGTAANITASSNSTLTTLSALSLPISQLTGGPLPVSEGGTGDTSLTAYAVLAGGTISTGALQQVSGLGSAGQALVSNGASALPSWQGVAGSLSWQSVQTSNFNATVGNGYPVNTTSGSLTATLPASPSIGNIVFFVDYAGTFATNNLIINLNGNKYNGIASNISLTINNEAFGLVYIDSTRGWMAWAGFNTSIPKATSYSANYLAVAGGGAGANYGGGGAGGLLQSSATFNAGTIYTISIGSGGSGAGATGFAASGTNSSISGSGLTTITAIGGGGAGYNNGSPGPGNSGGSGGGGGQGVGGGGGTGGSGTAGQGNSGGSGVSTAGGGGGGAGGVGSNATNTGVNTNDAAGNGGVGLSSSITGTPTFFAGGGGGAAYTSGSGSITQGTGGSGGGANGSGSGAINGTSNTGGGGGGYSNSGGVGGNGGSGVVILSISTTNYSGSVTGSPVVTTSGGNTILTFNGSGTYTA